MYYNKVMLVRVSLENFAIIEALELSFQPGMNVITGETGSGKSLVLDAIQTVFEKRFSPKEFLRHGTQRGRVELIFALSGIHNCAEIQALLDEIGVDLFPDEGELMLARDFTATGSRCRINGCQVPAEAMERVGALVLEIYGQHDLHSLFSSARQRDMLDNLGGEPLLSLKHEVRQTFRQLQQVRTHLEELRTRQQDRERQLDFLSYQLQEIAQAEIIDPHEDLALQLERERLKHSDALNQTAEQVVHLITADGDYDVYCALSLLGKAQKVMNQGASLDSALEAQSEKLQGIQEELRTLAYELAQYQENLESDPQRLHEIIDRLDTLEKLKRKFGGSLEEVLSTATRLQAEWEALDKSEASMTALESEFEALENRYLDLSQGLSELRHAVSKRLKTAVQAELESLMLPAATFDIDIQPAGQPSEIGQDQVKFLFSANPGEPLKPLAQVASGGEMSRLMLALKIQTAHADALTTLILDEIDTGMSGITVRAITEKLQTLQQTCQLIIVTHQPILAAKAGWHLHIQKYLGDDSVTVNALTLTDEHSRKVILSRLASGFAENDAVTAQFVEQLLGS